MKCLESLKSTKLEAIPLVAQINAYKQNVLNFAIITPEFEHVMRGPYNKPETEYSDYIKIDGELPKKGDSRYDILSFETIYYQMVNAMIEEIQFKLFNYAIEKYGENKYDKFYIDPEMDLNITYQDDCPIFLELVLRVIC